MMKYAVVLLALVGCGGQGIDAAPTGMLLLGDAWHCNGTMAVTRERVSADRETLTGTWACKGEAPHSDWTPVRLSGVLAGNYTPSTHDVYIQFASHDTTPFQITGTMEGGSMWGGGATDADGSVPAGDLRFEAF